MRILTEQLILYVLILLIFSCCLIITLCCFYVISTSRPRFLRTRRNGRRRRRYHDPDVSSAASEDFLNEFERNVLAPEWAVQTRYKQGIFLREDNVDVMMKLENGGQLGFSRKNENRKEGAKGHQKKLKSSEKPTSNECPKIKRNKSYMDALKLQKKENKRNDYLDFSDNDDGDGNDSMPSRIDEDEEAVLENNLSAGDT